MRSSPAFKITIERFGTWRAAVASLTGLAALALAAWWAYGDGASRSLSLTLAFVALSLGAVAGAASLLQCRPAVLRWDAPCWHLERDAAGAATGSGKLAIALDLGAWMLLRFEHDGSAGHRRITWLPVQRRGLEAQWHALRCAVYCARSARGDRAKPPSAMSPESQE